MTDILATIQNSPAVLVSIIFFLGYTVGVWGLPAIQQLLSEKQSN